jgi:undecaprenyl-diphosphatase
VAIAAELNRAMTDVQQAAAFLADHAVLLLGLAVSAVALAAVATVFIVKLLTRYQERLLSGFTAVVSVARRIDVVDRIAARTSTFVPNAYIATHLGVGLLVTIAVTVFLAIAEETMAGEEFGAFDTAFSEALGDRQSPLWHRVFTAVSWLGSRPVLAAATLAVAAFLLAKRRTVLAFAWVMAQAGGGVLNLALKETFQRSRPELADALLASSWSFPSGHAMGTFIFFGLACYVLLRDQRSWPVATVTVSAAGAWSVIMAFSRLYLGVHYPTDVVAGLVAGAAWVAVCASGIEAVRRRRDARARA